MLKFWMADLYHHVPQMNAPPNKLVLARGLIAIWVNLKDSWTLISLNSSSQVIWEIFHDYFGPEHLSIEKRGLYLSQARNDETTTGGHHQQPRPRGAKCNSWLWLFWWLKNGIFGQSDVLFNDFECTYCIIERDWFKSVCIWVYVVHARRR